MPDEFLVVAFERILFLTCIHHTWPCCLVFKLHSISFLLLTKSECLSVCRCMHTWRKKNPNRNRTSRDRRRNISLELIQHHGSWKVTFWAATCPLLHFSVPISLGALMEKKSYDLVSHGHYSWWQIFFVVGKPGHMKKLLIFKKIKIKGALLKIYTVQLCRKTMVQRSKGCCHLLEFIPVNYC